MSPLLQELIEQLQVLPGVGPKSAQRMAFQLLERDRGQANALGEIIQRACEEIGRCKHCRTFSEHDVCKVCEDTTRDASLLCVVESPSDLMAIEQATAYRGHFFVLMGRLSPLDGIGPEELGLDALARRLEKPEVTEVILALNATVEGEATGHYIATLADRARVKVTRLAQGVPVGGELEYLDRSTLAQAFGSRRAMED
jgi:recombination protein RecR